MPCRAALRLALLPAAAALLLSGCDCGGGLAVALPIIVVEPPSVDFGGVVLGASATERVQIRSAGSGPLNVQQIELARADEQLRLDASLATDCLGFNRPGGTRLGATECALVLVTYAPQKPGAMQNVLRILSDDPNNPVLEVPLAGEGLAPAVRVCAGADGATEGDCSRLEATPPYVPDLEFGAVARGETVKRRLRVSNPGRAPLRVTTTTLEAGADAFALPAGGFSAQIEAEGFEDLEISFTPPERGEYTGRVKLRTNAPEHGTLEVALHGEGLGPAVSVCVVGADGGTPESACTRLDAQPAYLPVLDFGPVTRRAEKVRALRVRNTGRAPLHVASATVAAGADAFSLPGAAFAPTLAEDGAADLSVRFSPPARGSYNGKLRLRTDDPDHPEIELILLGSGIAPTVRVCVPTPAGTLEEAACSRLDETPPFVPAVALGNIALGGRGARLLRVLNVGQAPLALSAVSVPAGSPVVSVAATGVPGSVDPGLWKDIEVGAAPTSESAVGGTVRIASDDDAHPQVDVPVTAAGIAPQLKICPLAVDGSENPQTCSQLRASPPFLAPLDFDHVVWGQSRTKKLRLRNAGLAPMSLSATTLTSTTGEYDLGAGADAAYLVPGDFRDVEVVFHPTVTQDLVQATVTVRSNDPVSPRVEVPIKGYGDGAKLCISPTSLDFGTVPHGTSSTLPVTLTNCGQVAYRLKTIARTPTAPTTTQFSGPLPAANTTMAIGAVVTINITYTPAAAGANDNAVLAGTTDYGSFSVPLHGVGGAMTCATAKPTARVTFSPAVPAPLTDVAVSGTTSSTPRPGGTIVEYTWSMVPNGWPTNDPNGAGALQAGADAAHRTLKATLAGDYWVRLVVKDSAGCQSDPTDAKVYVRPSKTIHVQLTWPNSHSDIDVHYIRPGGSFAYSPGDVYFANKTPDWGLGAARNPTLDIDDTWGYGPENVNQQEPANGTYAVKVHNYCNRTCFFSVLGVCFDWNPSRGSSRPLLKIFVDGQLAWSATAPAMYQRDIWHAAIVTVTNGAYTVVADPTSTPVTHSDYTDVFSPSCTEDTD